MKYLCLVYFDEKILDSLSKDALASLHEEALAFKSDLEQSGQLIASQVLQPTRDAATVRSQLGRISVTDGPFAETKEQLGGFLLIDAKDLNEAIQVASRLPPLRLGCVEVRPIKLPE